MKNIYTFVPSHLSKKIINCTRFKIKFNFLFFNFFFFFVAILHLPNNSQCQVNVDWIQRYDGPVSNGDMGKAIAVDKSGNVYVGGSGYVMNFSPPDYITIKYNSAGVRQWVRTYNGPSNEEDNLVGIVVDNFGNCYVTGTSRGGPITGTDIATIKYDSNGNQQWVRRINGNANWFDEAKSITIDNIGNIYVTGMTLDTLSGRNYATQNYTTVKYNSPGFEIWLKHFNFGSEVPEKIAVDNFGNVFVTGGSRDSSISGSWDYATIKYNSLGNLIWLRRYNGPVNLGDVAVSMAIDHSGNIYVTGSSYGINSFFDYATIKYNTFGNLQWIQRYNGPGNSVDQATSIAVDDSGNACVTGTVTTGSGDRIVTIKYNAFGIQQWIRTADSSGIDGANSIVFDNSSNVYVTGYSNDEYITIKYDISGNQKWLQRYNPGFGENQAQSIVVDDSQNVYVTGHSFGESTSFDIATIKYIQTSPKVKNPFSYSKWIAGQRDTIKWTPTGWVSSNIKCITNFGTLQQNQIHIVSGVTDTFFIWTPTDTILSYRSRIRIENSGDSNDFIQSDIFRIKPYVLTRVNSDSTYYEYKKDIRDRWGFSNDDMWSPRWESQFNYRGLDPFTGSNYSQWQGNFTFFEAQSSDFPDWISWVNTFTVNACYNNVSSGTYNPYALERWKAIKREWKGSCTGLAISNGLVFKNKSEFLTKYPHFPVFVQPVNVESIDDTPIGDTVKRVINEIYTHLFGGPHRSFQWDAMDTKTPTQTLNEMKTMLFSDNDPVRSLDIMSSKISHTILPYKITKSVFEPEKYFVYVYDNSYPYSNTPIIINTAANGGAGTWFTSDWGGTGGNKGIYLREPVTSYLTNPTLMNNQHSPFTLSDTLVEIFNPINSSIKIKDTPGNVTGFFNDSVHVGIQGSVPLVYFNSHEDPPYGYKLKTDIYSILIDNFNSDTINSYFFTGNQSISYERYGALNNQRDELCFDGGISIANPDAEQKEIGLSDIINETTQQKVFAFRSIKLSENDSVHIEKVNNDNIKIISYGSTKRYDLELNLAASTKLDRFRNFQISIPSNSSHTLVPDWTDITNNQLIILEDFGNNGSIDDTLKLNAIKALDLTVLMEGFYNSVSNKTFEDTIRLFLRNIFLPFDIIDSAKSILDSNGNTTFNFQNALNTVPYYIEVKHRNSIETWTSQGRMFQSNEMSYDFTTSSFQAFGNNMILKGNKFCIYSGDVDQNGVVNPTDLDLVNIDSYNFITGYIKTDLNGDSLSDLKDLLVVYNNSIKHVEAIVP